jgi:SNF2 family DNA or RNA helicase
MRTPSDLRQYQWKAIKFGLNALREHGGTALLLDKGLGKTVAAASIIKAMFHGEMLEKAVLLCAPIRVIHGVWRQQSAEWSHTRRLRFSLVHGNQRQRLQALTVPADVYLINPENMVWLLTLLRAENALKNWPFDFFVVDESTMFKAAGTKRFAKLRHYVHLFKYRMILTGGVRPNGLADLWAQFYIVDCGQRLGTSFSRFQNRFFAPDNAFKDYPEMLPRPGSEDWILNAISDVAISMQKEDWLELPPTTHNHIYVDLPAKVRADVYDELERRMFVELDKGDVEALNAASLFGKCHQIANGALYAIDGTGEKVWQELHDAKIEALDSVIEETASPVLVAYHFKHDLARLQIKYPNAPVFGNPKTLSRMIGEWNEGKHRIMFAHYQAVSHGIDGLQHGGHTLALFSLTSSYERYDQFIDRIGGARAQQPVMVHHIVTRDTVDEALLATLDGKHHGQRGFLTALKDYRARRQA